MFMGDYEFGRFNLKKIGTALTRQRSFPGAKKMGALAPSPRAQAGFGNLSKTSSRMGSALKSQKPNTATAVKKPKSNMPNARAQSAFENLGKSSSRMGSALKSQKRVMAAPPVSKFRKRNNRAPRR